MTQSKKQIAVAALGVVAIITLTALVTYFLTDKYGNATKDATTINSQAPVNPQPDLASIAPTAREEKIPNGTLSPTTVNAELIKNADTYKDKEISVRGLIIRISDNEYRIIGQELQSPGTLRIDTAKSTDITAYAEDVRPPKDGKVTEAPKPATPVTALGTVSLKDGFPTLTVKSVSK